MLKRRRGDGTGVKMWQVVCDHPHCRQHLAAEPGHVRATSAKAGWVSGMRGTDYVDYCPRHARHLEAA